MRLDKFIAQQLGVSRAIAGREIRGSRVTVDGDIVKDASFKLQPEHEVEYDGNTLTQQNGPRYFMLNKPQGYVCSTDDPDHPTILYFLDEPVAHKLHAAGRLDIDTTGLVLMTDDGQWSHRITSPRHHCEKTYLVALESPLADRESFPVESLKTEPFIDSYPGMETDITLIFDKLKARPDARYSTMDITATYAMVSAGLGISVNNAINHQDGYPGVVERPMNPHQMMEIGLACGENLAPAAQAFLDFVKERLPE